MLDLEVEGGSLRWWQRWRGLDGGGGFVSASEPGRMVQFLPVFDEWQDELERSLHGLGNFHLQRQQPDGLRVAGMPDGVFIQVVFPVHRGWLPGLVGFYERLWASWDRGRCPIAYAYLCEIPATELWPAHIELDEVAGLLSYARDEYAHQLGLMQRAPDDPVRLEDGGFEVTIRRTGFMHVASATTKPAT